MWGKSAGFKSKGEKSQVWTKAKGVCVQPWPHFMATETKVDSWVRQREWPSGILLREIERCRHGQQGDGERGADCDQNIRGES